METTESNSPIPADILADLDAVVHQLAEGGVRDQELLRRVWERSDRLREELRQKYGAMDVAVSLIREIRDEE